MRGRADIVLAVFAGGCLGGLARYLVVRGWPVGFGGFPWPTLAVNLLGAFVLAVLLVLAGQVWQSRYVRPLLGTGFCGAFTTFSSVVVDADRLAAHGAGGIAVGYLAASFLGGVAAAALGLVAARVAVDGFGPAGGTIGDTTGEGGY